MTQRGIQTTDVIDIWLNGRGAAIGASGGSTAEFSPLTDNAKNGGYRGYPFHAKFRRKGSDSPSERTNSTNATASPYSRVQQNHQTTHLQDWHSLSDLHVRIVYRCPVYFANIDIERSLNSVNDNLLFTRHCSRISQTQVVTRMRTIEWDNIW